MIRKDVVRALASPSKGVRYAVLSGFLGLLIFVAGTSLTFGSYIQRLFDRLDAWIENFFALFIPQEQVSITSHLFSGLLIFIGFALAYYSFRTAYHRLVETLSPNRKSGVVDNYLRRRVLAQGPNIVAIGGGTGLSTLLRGLKEYSSNITAIVTVADDGGSSGRLVKEMGIIPPGDIRNCLVALAEAEQSMTALFQHRFKSDAGPLSGHSVGNLLLAALVSQNGNDYEKAIAAASDVLNIRGRVVPSTLEEVRLRALMLNGTEICGESAITESKLGIQRVFIEPEDPKAYEAAVTAIKSADLICIGPGSVYTSVIPNLLVPGIADAIKASKVPRVYICNVMTQPGETDGFSAFDHAQAIVAAVGPGLFDYVMVNTGMPPQEVLDRYEAAGAEIVEPDIDRIRESGLKVISGDFMSSTDLVRHNQARIAARLVQLA